MNATACQPLRFDPAATPSDVRTLLDALAEEYPVASDDPAAWRVIYRRVDSVAEARVVRTGGEATVFYHTLSQAARATGGLLAGLPAADGELREDAAFDTFGALICAAHNKVFTVPHVCRWMRRLALFGYTQVLLYVDDAYEVPGEPFFGYLRGRYTAEEIRAVDECAARLGLELIPAIQTLGHLVQILQWPAYYPVKDTRGIVLVDEPKTYDLLEKMIRFWADNTRGKRIHLGMDEAHDLGRGVFQDRHGHERGFDLFNRHLRRVVDICNRYRLEPLIWSDMYFRMGSPDKQTYYYTEETKIPADVKASIPPEVRLAYWDYYHADKAFYVDYIARHRALGSEPVMASGVWNWTRLWYDPAATERNAGASIDACREAKLRDILFTSWGDDGSFCDFDSALAGFAFCAERAFSVGGVKEDELARRFAAACGSDYEAHRRAGALQKPLSNLNPVGLLWDNPLYSLYFRNAQRVHAEDLRGEKERLAALARELSAREYDQAAGDFNHARLLAEYLSFRIGFADDLFRAWEAKDRTALAAVREKIPDATRMTEALALSFRRQWLPRCKPFGLEVIQLRFAGIAEGFRELGRRLDEYAAGTIPTIPELDANSPAPEGRLGSIRFANLFTACLEYRG